MPATVRDVPERHRYEISVDGVVAGAIAYRLSGDTIILVHTEIEKEFSGRGLGSVLVKHALDDIRARGLHLDPVCPYVQSYLERHPEYSDLLDAGDGT